ncbi:MAG: hypothetical protein B6D79_04115 [gamma proteobacterium symbiont of Ctena orbiculata]|nr:MAG: hypothetical protein B6D79_04115 [gamma proteobacterium symbiont of Ctena orbiculata]
MGGETEQSISDPEDGAGIGISGDDYLSLMPRGGDKWCEMSHFSETKRDILPCFSPLPFLRLFFHCDSCLIFLPRQGFGMQLAVAQLDKFRVLNHDSDQ